MGAFAPDHPRVKEWLTIRTALEQQLEPLGAAALAKLDPRPGERILDIGCGIGSTPVALAHAVGPTGRVLACDLLPDAIAVLAHDRDRPPQLDLVSGDAQSYAFPAHAFDAIFSRFGVMFFTDAIAAFRNIAGAVRPGGRLAFTCWRSLADNQLDHLPLRAAAPCLPADLVAATEHAPWFAFCDPAKISATLHAAGWNNVEITAHDIGVGCDHLEDMVRVCSRVGALGAILRSHPRFRSSAVPLLRDALSRIDGPRLTAAIWVITANRAS